jgi:tetratricopeptide (TPR) repeat protein
VLSARALLELGEARRAAGNDQGALAAFKDSAKVALDAGRIRDAVQALERIGFLLDGHATGRKVMAVAEEITRSRPVSGPPATRIGILLDNARLLLQFGRLESAEEDLKAAAALLPEVNDLRLESSILQLQGQVRRAMGRPAEALDIFRRRTELEHRRGDARDLAYSLNSLGAAQTDVGAYAGAIGSFNEALRLMEEIADPSGTAMLLNGIALPLHHAGRSEESLHSLTRALAIQERLGRPADIAVTLNIRGEVLRGMGRVQEAIADLERSCAIDEEEHDERGLSFTLPRLGRARLAAGLIEEALDDLEMGVEVAARNPDRRQVVRALHALGDGLLQAGETREGIAHLRRACELLGKMDDPFLRAQVEKSFAAGSRMSSPPPTHFNDAPRRNHPREHEEPRD